MNRKLRNWVVLVGIWVAALALFVVVLVWKLRWTEPLTP